MTHTPTVRDVVHGTARLVVVAGEAIGRKILLDRSLMVIGRSEDCEISFDSAKLSRRHAQIRRIGALEFEVRDLKSRNGTFVNGEEVITSKRLHVGDKLRLGSEVVTQLTLHDPLEEELKQRQRFEALGRATAGIAHDFNNMLGAVIGNLEYLQRLGGTKALDADDVVDCLDDVHTAAARASQLSERLLSFARGEREGKSSIHVSDVCDEVAEMARRTFPRGIDVEVILEGDLFVAGDSLELHQVLMNLCINARDAMPQGGQLTMRAELNDSNEVMVSVTDTGRGMDKRTQAQIFEPFFTTKEMGSFGLGLATVAEIVGSFGGRITVESALGEGTRFDIFLPAASPATGQRTSSDIRTRDDLVQPGPPMHILLVDDEEMVRRSIRRVLTQAGHVVTEAETGQEAVALYRIGPRPDLVLLDLDMPKVDGGATMSMIRRIDPAAKVIVISGHRDRKRERELRNEGALAFVRKPAQPGELVAAIELARVELGDDPEGRPTSL